MKTKLLALVMIIICFYACTQQTDNNDPRIAEYEAAIQEESIDGLDTIFVNFAQAVGDSVAVNYVLGNDTGYYAWYSAEYVPKLSTIKSMISYVPAKSLIYRHCLPGHDVKSALWLFCIEPDTVLARLAPTNTWYSPSVRGEIKRRLIEYYDDSMGEDITIKVANITPDKTLTNYMRGEMETSIFKFNRRRIEQIYSKMSAHQICAYAQNQSTYFQIGSKAYLKENLYIVNCDNLAQLKAANLITEKQFKDLFKKRPKTEQESFDPNMWVGGD